MKKNKLSFVKLFCKLGIIVALVSTTVFGIPVLKNNFLITVDGKEQELSIDGVYAADALETIEASLIGVDYIIEETIDEQSFIKDMPTITIITKKEVTVKIDGETFEYEPYIQTVQEFLDDETTEVFKAVGEIELEVDEPIITGTIFEIKTLSEDQGTEYQENEELEKGTENEIQAHKPKRTIKLHQIVPGAEGLELHSKVIDKGQKQIIERGTKSIAPAVPTDSIWDQLAFCESGGNWSINTGNGYYGGLQFSGATWNTASSAVGLNIAYASDATREEQILAASWLQARSGWGQWPACSAKLGLM